MQTAFDFGAAGDIADMRDKLVADMGPQRYFPRRAPIGQLVKSMISSRTKDAVSLAAYDRLVETFANWPRLAEAAGDAIEEAISAVQFADAKAEDLKAALQAIAVSHPDFDLDFLKAWPVVEALAWLEALAGVGRKVAAATLNFSTLDRPAFVVDTHVLRILRRYGLVRARAQTEDGYRTVMEATPGWSALDLAELHLLLKRLGQTVCHAKRGACPACPINQHCRTAASPFRPAAA